MTRVRRDFTRRKGRFGCHLTTSQWLRCVFDAKFGHSRSSSHTSATRNSPEKFWPLASRLWRSLKLIRIDRSMTFC